MDKGYTQLRFIPAGEHGMQEGTKQGTEFGRKIPCLGSRKVSFFSGNTCPGEQVLGDRGKIVFLVGPCQLVLKRHFGLPTVWILIPT